MISRGVGSENILPCSVEVKILGEMWKRVLQDITKTLGSGCCQSWFLQAEPYEFNDGTLLMQTNQRLVKDRLTLQYNKELLLFWKKYLPQTSSVEVIVNNDTSISNEMNFGLYKDDKKEDDKKYQTSNTVEQFSYLDPRFTFEDFIVGKSNEFAYTAALKVATSEVAQFNPLFLYGGVGLGKTHLMHATAWKLKEMYPKRKVLYLSAEQFMYQFIKALRFKDAMGFKDHLRSVDVLMIDDFQFIGGKETTQEEFFHTFNVLVESNKQVIISADKSPADLENIGDRLKSRLGWGLVADIHPTTYELRLGILQAKIEQLKVDIPKEVIEFMAAKITSNVRELEGALNRIIAHSSLVGGEITMNSTREVLRDLVKSNEKFLTIENIQKRTCDFFNIKISDLLSSSRQQLFVRPRHVAMFLCKELTTKSLPEIGKQFGGRDHATIIHAEKKVKEFCAEDPKFAHDLEILKTLLSV
jgi:chromosomal replication initiator protein